MNFENFLHGNIGVRVFTNHEFRGSMQDAQTANKRASEVGTEMGDTIGAEVNTETGIQDGTLVGVDYTIEDSVVPLLLIEEIVPMFSQVGVTVRSDNIIISTEFKPRQRARPRLNKRLVIDEARDTLPDPDDIPTTPVGESITLADAKSVARKRGISEEGARVISMVSRGKFEEALASIASSD